MNRQNASFVSIQQPNRERGEWMNIPISRIQDSEEEVLVLGQAFRILVDNEIVYEKGGRKRS